MATATATKTKATVKRKKPTVVTPPAPLVAEKKERLISPLTGFTVGSDSDIIAEELIAGGASREEIAKRISARISTTSRNGTAKPVSNLMSGVIRRLKENGYVVVSSWEMTNPNVPKKRKKIAK